MSGTPTPMLPDFKVNPVTFLKEVKSELTKVVWPKRQEVIKLTGIVLGVSILLGVYIGGLDLVLTKVMNLMVK